MVQTYGGFYSISKSPRTREVKNARNVQAGVLDKSRVLLVRHKLSDVQLMVNIVYILFE